MHHWQYQSHCTVLYSGGRYYLLMQSSSMRASFFFFSFLSVSQSSIPLKEVIRKIMNNSLKLPILFFNILYSNCGFQMEFIHMSDVWNWTTTTLKSYVFFITLSPVFLSALTGTLLRWLWMVSVHSSSNS